MRAPGITCVKAFCTEGEAYTRVDKGKKFAFTGVPSKKNTLNGALKSIGTIPLSKEALDLLGINGNFIMMLNEKKL